MTGNAASRPAPRADGKIDVTVVYLEMAEPPHGPNPPPAGRRLALLRAEAPPLSFYRWLYDAVGAPWLWVDRKRLGDAELARIIGDERVEIYVLYAGGVPAGFAELDFRRWPEAQLAYFGLLPEFLGRGLGRYFLRWAVDETMRRGPSVFRVNTCNLDHPAALRLYQRMGFRPVATRQVVFDPGV